MGTIDIVARTVCGDGVELAGLHPDKPDGPTACRAARPVGDHVQELDDIGPKFTCG